MIGTTFDRYRIVALLGEGGMGQVWRADDTRLPRPVALKLIKEHLLDAPGARERFLREGKNASLLDHPGIVTVFDAGEIDGRAFIAYKFIEGESLEKRVTVAPLTVAEAIRLARDTAAALAHAHGKGVLHRDLSCNNVMIRSDGSPVIIDLGLARGGADSRHTTTGTLMGTVGYLAPEQWRGEEANEHTDLWALGVVWYRALLGRLPFGSGAMEAVMYRVLNEEPPKPRSLRAEVPEEFERIILELLEKDPRDRYASAEQLAAAVAGIRTDEAATQAVTQPHEAPTARLKRWWRKQLRRRFGPGQVGGAVGLAVVVVAAVVILVKTFSPIHVRVLAVMPLRNTSTDSAGTAYLAEGLGEELVRRLGRAREFRVLPWSTTSAYLDRRETPVQLARELGADVLLTGSFHGDDERVEVNAELVDGRAGFQMWSQHFAGALIPIQTEVAQAIAQSLAPRARLASRARIKASEPPNPEAYEYFLRGSSSLRSHDPTTIAMAEPMFEKALEIDPALAGAWVGLGAIHTSRVFRGRGGLENLTVADSLFRRALALEPGLSAAERGLLRVADESGRYRSEPTHLLDMAVRALERDPNGVEELTTAGWGFTWGGMPELALAIFDHVLKLDPRNEGVAWYRVFTLNWAGRPATCIAAGAAYIRAFGEDQEAYTWMGESAFELGRREEATLYFRRAVELVPRTDVHYAVYMLARIYRELGDLQSLREVAEPEIERELQALEAAPDNFRVLFQLQQLYAISGDLYGYDRTVAATRVQLAGDTLHFGPAAGAMLDLAAAGFFERALTSLRESRRDWVDTPWNLRESTAVGTYFNAGVIPALRKNREYALTESLMTAGYLARFARYRAIVARLLPDEPSLPPARPTTSIRLIP